MICYGGVPIILDVAGYLVEHRLNFLHGRYDQPFQKQQPTTHQAQGDYPLARLDKRRKQDSQGQDPAEQDRQRFFQEPGHGLEFGVWLDSVTFQRRAQRTMTKE